MATLTQDMKDMIGAQLNYLATADENGNPQVGPKGTMRVFDDHHLIYNEETGKQAWHNLQYSKKAAVATVDYKALKGFRFEGPLNSIMMTRSLKMLRHSRRHIICQQPSVPF